MSSPSIAPLHDRALIRVSGPDAEHFLQNLVTADIDDLAAPDATLSALLTPQGKILFDFLIYKQDGGYLIDAAKETSADLLKRLTFYRLRAKVDLEAAGEDVCVFALWGGDLSDTNGAELVVTDPRLATLGLRIVGPAGFAENSGASLKSLEDYDAHRVALGVPEGLKDFAYSDIFPHDADMDQLGGVSFKKGCYVGQEVVSRVHHRGTARKRFVQVEAAGALPERGTAVVANGKSVGELGSSTTIDGQDFGVALLRLDKVHQAIENGVPLTCGDVAITVRLPDWAEFGWPDAKAAV